MKAVVFHVLSKISLILVCTTITSCSKKEPQKADIQKAPASFSDSVFLEITPMLDGSAYATSLDSRLWYLRGNKACLVTVLSGASQKLPDFSEITPVLDGGAYATSWKVDSGLWYLYGEHAEKVKEVSSLSIISNVSLRISDKAFYALYLSEHKKRKGVEADVENTYDSAPESQEEDRY